MKATVGFLEVSGELYDSPKKRGRLTAPPPLVFYLLTKFKAKFNQWARNSYISEQQLETETCILEPVQPRLKLGAEILSEQRTNCHCSEY